MSKDKPTYGDTTPYQNAVCVTQDAFT
ncbi:uncharacterized protein METZ01_LOCUS457468 [marine metagenome]|uniref:Uncharacterized protein n=1 Tax=marine metagenome TaxID=408172 RepID=A0A383AAC3_9ZZZZ